MQNDENMNKNGIDDGLDDDLRDHYDFDYSKGRPNRFAEKFNEVACFVGLDHDVAEEFPTAEAVNDALREVIRLRHAEPRVPSR